MNQDQSAKFRELELQISSLIEIQHGMSRDLATITKNVASIAQTISSAPPVPTGSQIWNGELAHSVNSWQDLILSGGNTKNECAFWFAHAGTLSGLELDQTDGQTNAVNSTLKNSDHSNYNAARSRWNSARGWAEINGTSTVDQPLPSNLIDADTPLARTSLIAARRNKFIEIPATAKMFVGIYDNTAGKREFLSGSLGFNAVLTGGGAAQTVTRKYRIHVVTDRGFSLLSPEITVANAPATGFFTSAKNVSLSWKPTAGQLKVDVYEFSGGVYRHVAEV